MKVLIIGSGAVGQVFGLHLQNAGVEIGLYDKPATVNKLKSALTRGGLSLYQTSFFHRRHPLVYSLKNYLVLANAAECVQFQADQIWFTTPSPVYYSEWFRDFLKNVPSKRVVCFAPEGGRPEFFPSDFDELVVFAGTTFMAWQGGPQAGGGHPDGINFYRSPLGIPLTGKDTACRDVAHVLKKAGFRAMIGKSDSHMQAAVTAAMTAFVAGLELAGWSLKAFRNNDWRKRAAAACHEAILSQLARTSAIQRALLGKTVLSGVFHLTALLLPLLIPIDIEKYLKFHYRKTREQSLKLLNVFIEDGKKKGLAMDNTQILLQTLLNSSH
jgi:2-dehydropantoate 2-reductase